MEQAAPYAPPRHDAGTEKPPAPTPSQATASDNHTYDALNTNNSSSSSGGGAAGNLTIPLSNTSLVLAEFTSLLKTSDGEKSPYMKEHILHLLDQVDQPDTLVRVAHMLEGSTTRRPNEEAAVSGRSDASKQSHATTTTATTTTNTNNAATPSEPTASPPISSRERRRANIYGNERELHQLGFLWASGTQHRNTADSPSPSSGTNSKRGSRVEFAAPPRNGGSGDDDALGGVHEASLRRSIPATSEAGMTTGTGAAANLASTAESGSLSQSPVRASLIDPFPGLSHFAASPDPTGLESMRTTLATSASSPIATGEIPAVVRRAGRRAAISAAPMGDTAGPATPLAHRTASDERDSVAALREQRLLSLESGQGSSDAVAAQERQKTPAEERHLRALLKRCHLFDSLDASEVEAVIRVFRKEVHPAGTAILEQGTDSKERLYLIADGTCEAIKNGKLLGAMHPGVIFGELELMYKQAKCAATVRCVTRCTLYTLNETAYHRIIMRTTLQKRHNFEKLTLNVPFLRCLPDYERMKIAEALTVRHYKQDDYLIHFGDEGVLMHFLEEGDVKVVGRQQGRPVDVVSLHAGDVVGELEFLFGHLAVADVIVTSPQLQTACITRSHFELIVGPIHDRLTEFVATSASYETYYRTQAANDTVRTELQRVSSLRRDRRVRTPADPHAPPPPAAAVSDLSAASTLGAKGSSERVTAAAMAATFAARQMVLDRHGEVVLLAPTALVDGETTVSSAEDGAGHGSGSATNSPSAQALLVKTNNASEVATTAFPFPLRAIAAQGVVLVGLREDGVIFFWNSVMELLTNYPAGQAVGQNIYSFLLEEREQKTLLRAIREAKAYAGKADEFFECATITKHHNYTLARSDGLTKAVARLAIVPAIVSSGEDSAEWLMLVGEEVKQDPMRIVDQSQWLSGQIRNIVEDGSHTAEERLEYITEVLGTFDSTYRAMTVNTARLRVVNVREMMGQVIMEFGADCVARGISVCQRFENLSTEQAYLDVALLPECLKRTMRLCVEHCANGHLTLTVTVTEKNGLEFLVINFNISSAELPEDITEVVGRARQPSGQAEEALGGSGVDLDHDGTASNRSTPTTVLTSFAQSAANGLNGNGEANKAEAVGGHLSHKERRQLRVVRDAVEQQGGTMLVQRNAEDNNIVFLIPFMPATEDAQLNASLEESLSPTNEAPHAVAAAASATSNVTTTTTTNNTVSTAGTHEHGHAAGPKEDAEWQQGEAGVGAASEAPDAAPHPVYNFTTLVSEEVAAHRNMLCAFLWERKHAVLAAHSIEDIERLAGVADILIIDPHQSILRNVTSQDPINLLHEKTRQMAVVITARHLDQASMQAYDTAGFITLKKPCSPMQAMQAIRKAENKIAALKQEAERINQIRETLSRNSRGAWRRGRLLGKGTFGEVYEAVDVLTGGTMAVKEMRLDRNKVKLEQFVTEISTMCNLQHPNIIHYFYCEQSPAQNVLRVFMEYAAGGTLQELLKKRGKLPFDELQRLIRDITEGLAYIHSQHYVHGDIKTANVLLGADGKGKIGDFGTARTVKEGQLLYEMQGSPLYMSPECMSAGDLDEDQTQIGYSFPTDIWSLGCVAMEMITNKPPFAHITSINGPAGLTRYITSLSDTPDLSPLFDARPCLIEFVSACLNPDPAHRATARDLLHLSLFSEGTDEDTKSALQALKRAQLLHVLNQFVAFQDPPEATEAEAAKPGERVMNVPRMPSQGSFNQADFAHQQSFIFFNSSSSSSSSSSSGSEEEGAESGGEDKAAAAAESKPQATSVFGGEAQAEAQGVAATSMPRTSGQLTSSDTASPTPTKRSRTMERVRESGGAGVAAGGAAQAPAAGGEARRGTAAQSNSSGAASAISSPSSSSSSSNSSMSFATTPRSGSSGHSRRRPSNALSTTAAAVQPAAGPQSVLSSSAELTSVLTASPVNEGLYGKSAAGQGGKDRSTTTHGTPPQPAGLASSETAKLSAPSIPALPDFINVPRPPPAALTPNATSAINTARQKSGRSHATPLMPNSFDRQRSHTSSRNGLHASYTNSALFPPGASFFNFNKHISFLGSNMEEVLNSAANDFLHGLSNAEARLTQRVLHRADPATASTTTNNSRAPSSAPQTTRESSHGVAEAIGAAGVDDDYRGEDYERRRREDAERAARMVQLAAAPPAPAPAAPATAPGTYHALSAEEEEKADAARLIPMVGRFSHMLRQQIANRGFFRVEERRVPTSVSGTAFGSFASVPAPPSLQPTSSAIYSTPRPEDTSRGQVHEQAGETKADETAAMSAESESSSSSSNSNSSSGGSGANSPTARCSEGNAVGTGEHRRGAVVQLPPLPKRASSNSVGREGNAEPRS